MIRKLSIVTSLFAVLSFALHASAGQIVDGVVATVNGHVILRSDWRDELRFEAFLNHQSLDQISSSEQKAALDRLIDQELLREQMRESDFPRATEQEIDQRIQEIRGQYPEAATDSGWQAVLQHYSLTPSELKRRVAHQIDVMRLVDAHLRPNINIDDKNIESYYNQELLPQMRQSGAKEVPLSEVTPKIKEILTEQKENELLVAWLRDLRSGSEITTQTSPSDSRDQVR